LKEPIQIPRYTSDNKHLRWCALDSRVFHWSRTQIRVFNFPNLNHNHNQNKKESLFLVCCFFCSISMRMNKETLFLLLLHNHLYIHVIIFFYIIIKNYVSWFLCVDFIFCQNILFFLVFWVFFFKVSI
jgi:hypothetical protein